jgi:hypothetical protein
MPLLMDIRDLVSALLTGDLLAARQWVADSQRAKLRWESVAAPIDCADRELAVAAAVTEMLALRAGATPPEWTRQVGPLPEPLVLDPGLETMPRSFARARSSGPEPLRRRNMIALPGFLDIA